jgi:hypothetical protein
MNKDNRPYLIFRLCILHDGVTDCNNHQNCGYFWGPANELSGQKATFSGLDKMRNKERIKK